MRTTRKFGNKTYQRYDFAFSKREARQETKHIRKSGNLARMVKSGEGYAIFRKLQ